MTLEEAWKNQKELNALYSNNSRKLTLAMAAICWFFRSETEPGVVAFPILIIASLLAIVMFFGCDISLLLIQTVKHVKWIQEEEAKLKQKFGGLKPSMEIERKRKLDRPADRLFRARALSFYFSCLFLIVHFVLMTLP